MARITGASAWEQEVYDHVTAHTDREDDMVTAYEELVGTTDSPAFAYLARLVLDDERRHHQLLDDLAQTIRTSAELVGEPGPIPDLALFGADRERILAETERFLAGRRRTTRSSNGWRRT